MTKEILNEIDEPNFGILLDFNYDDLKVTEYHTKKGTGIWNNEKNGFQCEAFDNTTKEQKFESRDVMKKYEEDMEQKNYKTVMITFSDNGPVKPNLIKT
jgi:hypothetical protein